MAKKNALNLLLVFSLLAFSSCSRKISFQTSGVVPAARGYVKMKKDNNNNYSIQVHITNLAEVKRLSPSRMFYIVWMSADGNTSKNIGQINSSSGWRSSKLKADFQTVSAIRPSRIFITAEDDASIQYPGSQTILSTEGF